MYLGRVGGHAGNAVKLVHQCDDVPSQLAVGAQLLCGTRGRGVRVALDGHRREVVPVRTVAVEQKCQARSDAWQRDSSRTAGHEDREQDQR